jgi:hypothetical protein
MTSDDFSRTHKQKGAEKVVIQHLIILSQRLETFDRVAQSLPDAHPKSLASHTQVLSPNLVQKKFGCCPRILEELI